MKTFRDEQGFLRAKFDSPQEALSRFIEGDIQGSPELARRILDHLLSVRIGAEPDWKMTGNAFTLIATKEKAVLDNHYEELKAEVPLDDLIQAVSGWLKFLESTEK